MLGVKFTDLFVAARQPAKVGIGTEFNLLGVVAAVEELMTIELTFTFRARQFLARDPQLLEKGTP